MVFLGVDGGGTHTRVALVSEMGELLGLGRAGPGNYHDVGTEKVAEHIQSALTQAWQQTPAPRRTPGAAFLGMAGVSSEHDRQVIRKLAKTVKLAQQVEVDHDLRIALAGGLSGRSGIALIVGTGSSCFGRNQAAQTWQAGGFGSVLDDPGSSYDLGRQAMVASVRELDRRGPATLLRPMLMATLKLKDVRELIPRISSGSLKRAQIAALAPLVTHAAAEGDAIAQQIIETGAGELALMVATVAEQLQLEDPEVVTSGGLAASGPAYTGPLGRAIRSRVPHAAVQAPELEPVLGAAMLAAAGSGVEISPPFLERLREHCA